MSSSALFFSLKERIPSSNNEGELALEPVLEVNDKEKSKNDGERVPLVCQSRTLLLS
jgi:hypothetical protein